MYTSVDDEMLVDTAIKMESDNGFDEDFEFTEEMSDKLLLLNEDFNEFTIDTAYSQPQSPVDVPSPMTNFEEQAATAQTSPIDQNSPSEEQIDAQLSSTNENTSNDDRNYHLQKLNDINIDLEQKPDKSQQSKNFPIPQIRKKRVRFNKFTRNKIDKWLFLHQQNPYMDRNEKEIMMQMTGLTREQLNTYLTNHRMRKLKGEGYTMLRGRSSAKTQDKNSLMLILLQQKEAEKRSKQKKKANK